MGKCLVLRYAAARMRPAYILGVVALLACASSLQAKEVHGFDCWRLGMTRAEVRSCAQYGPYAEVRVTGGLETPNGDFEGARTNISFVFDDDDHLIKIQVWLSEATNLEAALSSATRAWQYLSKEFGHTYLAQGLVPPDASVAQFQALARPLAAALSPDKSDKFQFGPVSKVDGASVWTSVIRDPRFGYYVFLYFARP